MNMTIAFVIDRETKNTVRYIEDADPPKIGTLYIQKLAFADSEYPREIIVTVTAANGKRAAKAVPAKAR